MSDSKALEKEGTDEPDAEQLHELAELRADAKTFVVALSEAIAIGLELFTRADRLLHRPRDKPRRAHPDTRAAIEMLLVTYRASGTREVSQQTIRKELLLTEGQVKGALRRLGAEGRVRARSHRGRTYYSLPTETMPLPFESTPEIAKEDWEAAHGSEASIDRVRLSQAANGLARTKPTNPEPEKA